ncbi:Serine protease htra2 [Porites harrisoni]
MATTSMWRRWRHFQQMFWLSDKWKTKGIQHVCRQVSTQSKRTTKRYPWAWVGSLAFGVFLGYGLPKFFKSRKDSSIVKAKSAPRDDMSSNSGSPPRSVTFNFIADAVEIAAPAVVNIEVTGRHAGFFRGHVGPTSAGSGFIVTEDGMVLTNAHVVENAVNVSVKLKDGREFSGTVIDIDLENDLAAVKLDSTKNVRFPTLTLGSSATIRPGEWVIAMGSPLQLSNTITAGIVSTVHRAGEEIGLPNREMEYIQTDAAINVGNSGGPLVNLDGHAIGINAITVRFAAGISFSIPIDAAKDFLSGAIERVKSGKYMGRNTRQPLAPHQRWYIGVSMLTLTPQILAELRRRDQSFNKITSGVFVPQVNHGSPAHRGGLRSGDIITKMNGKTTESSKQVYQHVHKGETLKIEVKRGEQYLNFTVQPEVVG